MYKQTKHHKTTINVNSSYEGETIERKIRRIVNNKEPITDAAPLIYTERSKGVEPQYDIRTDRFEIAAEAMDKVAKSHIAKREERHKKSTEIIKEGLENKQKEIGKPEPIQGTGTEGTTK